MGGISDTKTITHTWNIDNVIDSTSWVYSSEFSSPKIRNVAFIIGLQSVTDNLLLGNNNLRKGIKVRVLKNDVRPAKATVKITQVVDKNDKSIFLSTQLSKKLRKIDLIDWKEFYNFKNRDLKNDVSCEFPHLMIKLYCEITWQGFYEEDFSDEKSQQITFSCFLKSGTFSDVVVVVDGEEMPAHKIVLSTRSPYFFTMLTSDMKEGNENRIEINNFSVNIVKEMLEYFYTNKTKASEDVNVALEMIELADMYQITKLKDICEDKLSENINIDNVLTILNAADDFNAEKLSKKAIDFMLLNKKQVLGLADLKSLCQNKPLLMFQFMCAMEDA